MKSGWWIHRRSGYYSTYLLYIQTCPWSKGFVKEPFYTSHINFIINHSWAYRQVYKQNKLVKVFKTLQSPALLNHLLTRGHQHQYFSLQTVLRAKKSTEDAAFLKKGSLCPWEDSLCPWGFLPNGRHLFCRCWCWCVLDLTQRHCAHAASDNCSAAAAWLPLNCSNSDTPRFQKS